LPKEKWNDVSLFSGGCDGSASPDVDGWITETFTYECISSAFQENQSGAIHLNIAVEGPSSLTKVRYHIK
jgi:hypothetical protein